MFEDRVRLPDIAHAQIMCVFNWLPPILQAMQMMEGEFESLLAIDRTCTLRVPRPHRVLPHPSGHGGVLVVEYLHFGALRKHQAQLGQDLAKYTLAYINT